MAKDTTKKTVQKKQAKDKKTAAAKAPKETVPAKTAAPKIFNNDDPEAKALFLQHRSGKDGKGGIKALKASVNTATANLRNAYKSAKAQGGFEKSDFDYADQLETAEAEAKTRAKIARNLQIARYMGSDLGAQLDMFIEPVRTPAADRAYEEGQRASMQGETAKPVYAPETEQYRRYMAGYHEHQESIVKAKMTKLDPEGVKEIEKEAVVKAKAKKQKAEDAKDFEKADATAEAPAPVTSGVGMTRADFEALQQKSHFQKQ